MDGLAALEHAPVHGVQLAEVLVVGAHRRVDAHEVQVVVDEREADGRGREDGVEQRQRALGDVVEPGVVDRLRAAAGERLGEREVRGAVVAALASGQERERAEAAAAGGQRHEHVRLGRKPRVQPVVDLLGRGHADVAHEDRLAGLPDLPRLRGAVDVAPHAADAEQHRLDLGVLVAARDLDLLVALAEDVDRAPVREVRHRQPRDAPQGLLVVERARQYLAGVGDESQRLAGGQDRLDVGVRHGTRGSRGSTGRARPPHTAGGADGGGPAGGVGWAAGGA